MYAIFYHMCHGVVRQHRLSRWLYDATHCNAKTLRCSTNKPVQDRYVMQQHCKHQTNNTSKEITGEALRT
jgi:hypothetical protein